jgi:hypothetical protein
MVSGAAMKRSSMLITYETTRRRPRALRSGVLPLLVVWAAIIGLGVLIVFIVIKQLAG